MRETNFIQQNKNKWQDFEEILEGRYHDPDKLNDLFVQITDDLSYSRTFYPNRSVRVYLNSLAQRIFFTIYKSRHSPIKKVGHFWLEELPQLVYEARQSFLLAFLVFLLSFAIGMLSSFMDPDFVRVILGDSYVNMTEENIRSGDPMAVYKERGQLGMALGITANNLWVAFLTFVMGVFYAVGSIVIMISNGIMVGAFQYFFIEKGLFWESFLTIWIHGTLEISAIIIAGAAGITMGKGLVFPGTYTRMQSFQRAARRGVKIMIGITPIIITAGFIEGYLTRHTDTPDSVRGLFILVCLIFVLTYFVWYPYFKSRKGFKASSHDNRTLPDRIEQIDFTAVKSPGEIFADVFVFFRKQAGSLIFISFICSALYCIATFLLSDYKPAELFYFPNQLFGTLSVMKQFFANDKQPYLYYIHSLLFAALILAITPKIIQESKANWKYSWRESGIAAMKVLFSVGLLMLITQIDSYYALTFAVCLLPGVLIWAHITQEEKANLIKSTNRLFFLLSQSIGRTLSLLAILLLVGLLFFAITDSVLLWFYLDLVSWLVNVSEDNMTELSAIVLTFVTMFFTNLIFCLFVIGFGLLYYTLKEIKEAYYLRQQVQNITLAKRIRGLEQEV